MPLLIEHWSSQTACRGGGQVRMAPGRPQPALRRRTRRGERRCVVSFAD